jgi:DNA repair exonuclease SbcCD ATPase subunit
MDMAAIGGAVSGLKAALEIGKGIQALKTSTEVRQKTSDLLDALLDARMKLVEAANTQSALLQQIEELEQKIASFEHWDSEKQRYQLKAIDAGAFAYMHKPGMENGEPAVWLCQTCFEKRHKSPLQFRSQLTSPGGGRGMHAKWGCNLCKAEVMVYYARKPSEPWEPKTDG